MLTKSQLAIKLSQLKAFAEPKIKSEQYATDSEVAADILWFAKMQGDINGKVIYDLGCGTGILGFGALLLGAKIVVLVDNDRNALDTAKQNKQQLQLQKADIVEQDIVNFTGSGDVVFQNPPFGTKQKHADREFLMKAFETASVIYSIHKASTAGFVKKLAEDHGFKITHKLDFDFPIKHQHSFHKRKIRRISVSCFRLAKIF